MSGTVTESDGRGGGGSAKVTESDGTCARSAPKIFGLQPPKNMENLGISRIIEIVDLFF